MLLVGDSLSFKKFFFFKHVFQFSRMLKIDILSQSNINKMTSYGEFSNMVGHHEVLVAMNRKMHYESNLPTFLRELFQNLQLHFMLENKKPLHCNTKVWGFMCKENSLFEYARYYFLPHNLLFLQQCTIIRGGSRVPGWSHPWMLARKGI